MANILTYTNYWHGSTDGDAWKVFSAKSPIMDLGNSFQPETNSTWATFNDEDWG